MAKFWCRKFHVSIVQLWPLSSVLHQCAITGRLGRQVWQRHHWTIERVCTTVHIHWHHCHRPWYDDECRQLRRKAHKLEHRYHWFKTSECYEAQQAALSNSRKMSHTTDEYWKTEIDDAGTDARRLWRSINTLLGQEKNRDGPSFSPKVFHDFIDRKFVLFI